MDLRALLINQIEPDTRKNVNICLFAFFIGFSISKANGQVQFSKVPYEVEFADVVFQLNDASRYLLSQEINKLSGDSLVKKDQLDFLTLFIPEVSDDLKKSDVPDDFKFLVVYNKYQLSTTQIELLENGIFWCLTKNQAIDVDLKVSHGIDQRKHLDLATSGAMMALLRNNVLYNNWGTTLYSQIASRSVINLLGINKEWNGKTYLPVDSPAYSSLIQFLAFKMVMENELQTYKSELEKIVYRYPYGSGKSLELIAADLRLDPVYLRNTNQWISGGRIDADDLTEVIIIAEDDRLYDLKVLAEISSNTNYSKAELYFPKLVADNNLDKGKGGSFYFINDRKGIKADYCDSYVTLAFKGDITINNFLEYNEMTEDDVTAIGQVYYLEPKKNKAEIPYHVTKEGENLWDISMVYGVKLEELRKLNRIDSGIDLKRGRVVWMQDKRPKKEEIEFVIPAERKQPESLKNDPLLSSLAHFSFEKEQKTETKEEENNVKVEQFVQESNLSAEVTEEYQFVAPKEIELAEPKVHIERVKRELVLKPVLNERNTIDIKSRLLGEQAEEKQDFVVHTVKKGETLYRISVNYKVSVNQLYTLNNLKSNIIEIGDKIKVKSL